MAAFGAAAAASEVFSFSFTLPAECDTSAGIFLTRDGHEQLVRTLWRSRRYLAGAHTDAWDGLDDQGQPAPGAEYRVRVRCSDIRYVWEGVIGNTSASFTGTVYQSGTGDGITDLASDGAGAMYAAFGYNEGQFDIRSFATSAPQKPRNFTALPFDVVTAFSLVACDRQRLYTANTGGSGFDKTHTTFVTAFRLRDGAKVMFPEGAAVSYPGGHYYPNCLDVRRNGANWAAATGLAVQSAPNGMLAISHGDDDCILLFNKTSGHLLGKLAAINPQKIAFAPNGDLWAIAGASRDRRPNAAIRFSGGKPVCTIGGLAQPLALAVSPRDPGILIADGGAQQMLKAFTPDGALRWQYGEEGGYAKNGPDVRESRFQFGESVPLAYQPDGSFWVGDGGPAHGGTGRVLHFSAASAYLGCISYLTSNSTVACDPNDPSRVFWDFLEYRVDYSKPLLPGQTGAWKLVKNWAAGVNPRAGGFGLNTVVTLAGRTYGLMSNGPANALVELPATGGLISEHQQWPKGYRPELNKGLYANGDIRYSTWNERTGVQQVYKCPFEGINRDGAPRWGKPVSLAVTSLSLDDLSTGSGYFGTSPIQFPITASNILITFNSTSGPGAYRGPHLGGTAIGGRGYLWKASPTVTSNVPPDGLGSYDIGDGISYAGNKVVSVGAHVIYGFHGEGYNQTEANQFMDFYEDGLFLGQFGTPGLVRNEEGPAIAGFAGNAFSPALAQTKNGEIYLYHNDESNHAGIHRWHLVGANDVSSLGGMIRTGQIAELKQENPWRIPVAAQGNGASGQLQYHGWETLCLDSSAAARGGFPLQLPKSLAALGTLLRANVGSQGYTLFGPAGIAYGPAPQFSVAVGEGSSVQNGLDNQFQIDGRLTGNSGLRASSLDITVPDAAAWHILTVIAPNVSDSAQSASVRLAPSGQEFHAQSPAPGYNRIWQFRFQGNVTLYCNQPLQGIFLDGAPPSKSP